jgi:DHA1 family inner membrane transport protein
VTDNADQLAKIQVPPAAEAIVVGEVTAHGVVDHALPVIAACMVVGTAALMILGVQPVLLGGLARAHWVSEAQIGPLATIEVLAIALGSAIGPGFLRSGAMRLKTAMLSLALAAANLAVYVGHTTLMLDIERAFAGLFEGLILGATIVITVQNRRPDRMNGLFLALSTLPQSLMAYLLPSWVTPRFGPAGGFAVLAVLAVISAGAAWFLVDSAPGPRTERSGRTAWTLAIVVALAAVGFQNAAIGGAWDYIQLLADQRQFSPRWAGIAVSGGLLFQVAGAFAVAAWGGRFPFRASLIGGALCQSAVIFLLASAQTPLLYLVPALCFGLFWLAMGPFQVRLLIDLDPTRGAALVLTAITLVGLSAGPSISALGVRGPDVTGAFWIAGALMVAACGLYGIVALLRR